MNPLGGDGGDSEEDESERYDHGIRKHPNALTWFVDDPKCPVHYIDPDNTISFEDLVTKEEHKEHRLQYERYVRDWYGHTQKGANKPCTIPELKAAKDLLHDEIAKNTAILTAKNENPQTFDQLLDADLYSTLHNPIHCGSLLHPNFFYTDNAGEGSDANRCTVYALNCLLGGPYFTNLRQYFNCVAAGTRSDVTAVHANFAKHNYIEPPVGYPFATLQHRNRLVNVTLVPKAQFCGAELENFEKDPILLDIALTLRAETTRVAVAMTGVAEPKSEVGTYNHMVVF